MCWKMCVTVALCLSFLLAFSEGFFMPTTLRKQAPQTYNSQHWIPTATGINPTQGNYANLKDYANYQQQQSFNGNQQPQQIQQQQPQPLYSTQVHNIQPTAPKYEATQFQPQYAFEGVYPAPLNSYPQSVQLVPCLCPVNKEVIEQQNQQQSSLPISPTSSSFPADGGNSAPAPPQPQPTQKKTTT